MNPLQALVYWKMFWIRLFLSTMSITCLAICSGLSGINAWNDLETTQKIIVIAGIMGVVATNMISMFDKTYASLSSNGKTLGDTNGGGGSGNTAFINKTPPSQPYTNK